MKLAVILGAGFSYQAGLPLGKDIAEYFDRDLRNTFLCGTSSEWYWKDHKSEVEIHNGRLNYDVLAYSYIFNSAVQEFRRKKGSFTNYEEFYQFLFDITEDTDQLQIILDKAKNQLTTDKPYINSEKGNIHKHYLFPFESPQMDKIQDILSYLINDLLRINISDYNLLSTYQPFIKYISRFKEVEIFTLNHDLVLERLLELNKLKFSRGFSSAESNLAHNSNRIPVFKNCFDEKIRVYKLHGSIDFFKFSHVEQTGPGWHQETGEATYFHTTNYYTKHNVKRIDPITGEVVQQLFTDVVPKFITGTRKTEIIEKDYLFKTLYYQFNKSLKNADEIFISGYSFCDEHINNNFNSIKTYRLLNQNPFQTNPLRESIEIKELQDLKKQ